MSNNEILVKVGQVWKVSHSTNNYTITRIKGDTCYYSEGENERVFGRTIRGYAAGWSATLISDADGLLYICPVCYETQCKTVNCG